MAYKQRLRAIEPPGFKRAHVIVAVIAAVMLFAVLQNSSFYQNLNLDSLQAPKKPAAQVLSQQQQAAAEMGSTGQQQSSKETSSQASQQQQQQASQTVQGSSSVGGTTKSRPGGVVIKENLGYSISSSGQNQSSSGASVGSKGNLQPMNPQPKGPKEKREGYSFAVPVEFGMEEPNSDNCCELWEVLQPTSQNEIILQQRRVVVAGAQKSGTTYLHANLGLHEETSSWVCRLKRRLEKEVHFFDNIHITSKEVEYYKDGFKLGTAYWKRRHAGQKEPPVLLESTPSYMRLPYVPCRLKKIWNGVKIIFLLRDPVERVLSHYYMNVARHMGNIVLIEDLINSEMEFMRSKHCTFTGEDAELQLSIAECFQCIRDNGNDYCYAKFNPEMNQSKNKWLESQEYKRHPAEHMFMSLYGPMIAEYLRYFKPEDILIIQSQDMLEDPVTTLRQIATFMGIDPSPYTAQRLLGPNGATKTVNARSNYHHFVGPIKQKSIDAIRPVLAEYFYPLNQQLYKLLDSMGYSNFTRFSSDLLVEAARTGSSSSGTTTAATRPSSAKDDYSDEEEQGGGSGGEEVESEDGEYGDYQSKGPEGSEGPPISDEDIVAMEQQERQDEEEEKAGNGGKRQQQDVDGGDGGEAGEASARVSADL